MVIFSVVFLMGLIGWGKLKPEIMPTPTFTPQEPLGSTLFSRDCGTCHSLWDASGSNNRFDDNASAFPLALPSSSWPGFARRAYENMLSYLVRQLL